MENQEIQKVERSAKMAAELLKALAHEKRLLILCKLYQGEQMASDIEEFVGISQSGLSQHLAVLRKKHIVQTRKVGTKVFYSLADQSTQDLMRVLCQVFKK
jgi:ArsR family transcriptional regulator, virulence genes transcriptional regulator